MMNDKNSEVDNLRLTNNHVNARDLIPEVELAIENEVTIKKNQQKTNKQVKQSNIKKSIK